MSSHAVESLCEKSDSEDPLALPEVKHELQLAETRIKEEELEVKEEEDFVLETTQMTLRGIDNFCIPAHYPDDVYNEGTSFLQKQIVSGNSAVLLPQSQFEEFSVLTSTSVIQNQNLSSNNYVCHFCNYDFPDLVTLNKHLEVNSETNKVYSCTICKKTCTTKCQLDRHLVMHKETGSYSCQVCRKSYTRKNSLRTHICVPRSDQQPYSCTVCNEIFRSKRELSIHTMNCSKLVQNEENPLKPSEILRSVLLQGHRELPNNEDFTKYVDHDYSCIVCSEKFLTKILLDEHISVHMKDDSFFCNECKKLFNNIFDLTKHTCKDVCPFTCNICGAVFTEKSAFLNHMTVHKNMKSLWCHVCKKSFTNNYELRSHICSSEDEYLRYLEEDCAESEIEEDDFIQDIAEDTSSSISTKSVQNVISTNSQQEPQSSENCESKILNNRNNLVGEKLKSDYALFSVLETVSSSNIEQMEDELTESKKKNFTDNLSNQKKNDILCEIQTHEFVTKNSKSSSRDTYNIHENISVEEEGMSGETIHSEEKAVEYINVSLDEKQVIKTESGSGKNSMKIFSPDKMIEEENNSSRGQKSDSEREELRKNVECEMTSESGSIQVSNLYNCSVCSKTFANKFDLNLHNTEHKANDKFSCHLCGKTFNWEKNITRHMYLHTGKRPYSCDVCGQSFVEKRLLSTHFRKHMGERPFSCNMCKKSYSRWTSFNYHVCSPKDCSRISREASNFTVRTGVEIRIPGTSEQVNLNGGTLQQENYACSVCGQNFTSRTDRNMHLVNHNDIKFFSCHICDKLFTRDFRFHRHLASHMRNQSFSCSLCKMTFTGKDSLSKHMSMHNKNHFICMVCNTGFHRRSTYLTHIRMHHNNNPYNKQNKFCCNVCNRSFYGRLAYARHACVDNSSIPLVGENKSSSVCELTDKTEADSDLCNIGDKVKCSSVVGSENQPDENDKHFTQNLNNELMSTVNEKTAAKSVNIPESSSGTQQDLLMRSGMNMISSEEKDVETYNCKICGKTFREANELNEHLFSHTSEFDLLSCPICKKSFKEKVYLREHFYVHIGILKLSCDFCGKSFQDNNTLNSHLDMHKNGLEFPCTVCSESFSCKLDVENHILTHNDSSVKYDCQVLSNSCLNNAASQISVDSRSQEQADTGGKSKDIVNETDSQNLVSLNCQSKEGKGKYDESVNITFTNTDQIGSSSNNSDAGKSCFTEIVTTNVDDKPSFSCNLCNRIFLGRDVLTKHLISHASKVKPFTCLFCNKTFNHKGNFSRHLCIHTGVRSFSCRYCKKSFIEKCTLKNHLRIHTGECPFTCHICKKSFLTLPHFKTHMKKHILTYNENEKGNIEKSEIVIDPKLKKKINCNSSVTRELKEDTSIVNVNKKNEDALLDICFEKVEILSPEMKDTPVSYPADHLEMQPKELSATNFHEAKNAQLDESVEESSESNKNKISTNKSSINLTNFTCSVCNKKFLGSKFLTEHLVTHTSKEMPFLCPICNKQFNRKSNLKKHLCIHTGVQPFSCTYCKRSFIEKSTLKNHISIHLKVRPFKCNICHQHFRLKSLLKSHVKRIHPWSDIESPPESPYNRQMVIDLENRNKFIDLVVEQRKEIDNPVCSVKKEILCPDNSEKCPEQLSNVSEEKEKFSSADPLERPTEELSGINSFNDEEMLTDHNLEELSTNSDKMQKNDLTEKIYLPTVTSFTCVVCDKSFSDAKLLTEHLLTHSSRKSPFLCPVCKKSFGQKSNLKKHLCIHTGDQPFSCTYCARSFIEKSTLKNHISVHFEERPFECNICKQNFRLKSLLKCHINRIHRWNSSSTVVYYGQNVGKTLTDVHLEKRKESPEGLEEQAKEVSNSSVCFIKTEILSPDNFENCPEQLSATVTFSEGSEELSSADCLEQQTEELAVMNNFDDGKEMLTDSNLEENTAPFSDKLQKNISTENRHASATNFTCVICDKNFTDGEVLTEHLTTHTSRYCPFLCPICSKSFTQKSNLKRHICIHTGVQPFSCTYCKKSFIEKSTLKNHILVHLKVRPFECKICKHRFRLRTLLNSHMKRFHLSGNVTSLAAATEENINELFEDFIVGSNLGEAGLDKEVSDSPKDSSAETERSIYHEEGVQDLAVCLGKQTDILSTHVSFDNREQLLEDLEEKTTETSIGDVNFVKTEMLSPDNFQKCTELSADEHSAPDEILSTDNVEQMPMYVSFKRETEELSSNYMDGDSEKLSLNNKMNMEKEIIINSPSKQDTSESADDSQNKFLAKQHGFVQNSIEKKNNMDVTSVSCIICDNNFSDGISLTEHLTMHTTINKPFLCPICSKPFMQKSNLKRHLFIHTGVQPYSCTYCEKSFIEKSTLKNHILVHLKVLPFECKICKKCFRLKTQLNFHMKTNHQSNRMEYVLDQLVDKNEISDHNFQTSDANDSDSSMSKNGHSKENLSENISYNKKVDNSSAVLSEEKIDRLSKDLCFVKRMDLSAHLEDQRNEISTETINFIKTEMLSPDNFEKCTEILSENACSSGTELLNADQSENLSLMETKEFSTNNMEKETEELPENYEFLEEKEMSTGAHLEEGIAKFSDCSLEQSAPEKVIFGQTSAKNENGPRSCTICDKIFSDGILLTEHLITHVSRHSPFFCPICTRQFTQKSSLKRHLRTHTGIQPFICTYCEKSFSEKNSLKKHILIHLKMRPFTCNICKRSFRLKNQLNVHVMRVHKYKLTYLGLFEKNTNGNEILEDSVLGANDQEVAGIESSLDLAYQMKEDSSGSPLELEEETNISYNMEKQNSEISTDAVGFVRTELTSSDNLNRLLEELSTIECFTKTKSMPLNRFEKITSKVSVNKELDAFSEDNVHNQIDTLAENNGFLEKRILFDIHSEEDVIKFSDNVQKEISSEKNVFLQTSAENSLTNGSCTICDKKFSDGKSLTEHLVTDHTSTDSPYICPICSKLFGVKSNLKRHLCIHTGVQPFSCTYCEKSFIERSTLKNHILIHLKVQPFVCKICSDCFRRKSDLNSHIKKFHKSNIVTSLKSGKEERQDSSGLFENQVQGLSSLEASDKEITVSDSSVNNNKRKQCSLESESLMSLSSLNLEVQTDILSKGDCLNKAVKLSDQMDKKKDEVSSDAICFIKSEIQSPDNSKQYSEAHQCSDTLPADSSEDPHVDDSFEKESEELSVYNIEGKAGKLSENFDFHSEQITFQQTSTEERNGTVLTNFSCNICDEIFSDGKCLSEHLLLHTSDNNPFHCPICNKPFNQKSNLKRHLCIHTGFQPFSCMYCEKSFIEKSTLKNHILVHLKIRPCMCKICKRCFRLRSDLNRHIKKVHKSSIVTSLKSVTDQRVDINELFEEHLQASSDLGAADKKVKVSDPSVDLTIQNAYVTVSHKQIINSLPSVLLEKQSNRSSEDVSCEKTEKLSNNSERQRHGITTDLVPFMKTEMPVLDSTETLFMDQPFIKSEIMSTDDLGENSGSISFKEEIEEYSANGLDKNIEESSISNIFHEEEEMFADSYLESNSVDQNAHGVMNYSSLTRFTCIVCKKNFSDGKLLIDHITTHRTKGSPFICPICNKSFGQKSNLKRHLCIHFGVHHFSCNYCKRTFIEKKSLQTHIVAHMKYRPLKCNICNQHFQLKKSLKNHLIKQHGHQNFITSEFSSVGKTLDYAYNLEEIPVDQDHLERTTDRNSDKEVENVNNFCLEEKLTKCSTKTQDKISPEHRNVSDSANFTCVICDTNFSEGNIFITHLVSHTSKSQPFLCPFCNKAFNNKGNLKRHLCIHTGIQPYPCAYCDRKFIEKKTLHNHILIHLKLRPFECDVCHRHFRLKYLLKMHLQKCHPDSNLTSSTFISEKLEVNKSIAEHVQESSSVGEFNATDSSVKQNVQTARICLEIFSSEPSEDNFSYEQTENNFSFGETEKNVSFEQIDNLSHEQIRDNFSPVKTENIFSCDEIKDDKPSYGEKDINLYQIASEQNSEITKQNVTSQFISHEIDHEVPCFTCTICSQHFVERKLLLTHLLSHAYEKKILSCPICDKEINYKCNLRRHLSIHTGFRPNLCSICSKSFFDKYDLKKHILAHMGERSFKCNLCSRRFLLKGELNRHFIKRHNLEASDPKQEKLDKENKDKDSRCETEEKNRQISRHTLQSNKSSVSLMPTSLSTVDINKNCFEQVLNDDGLPLFTCSICDLKFSDKSLLTLHLLTHSSKVSPFPCPVCYKSFGLRLNLRRHLSVHTGAKPFPCDICGKTFYLKSTLINHSNVHTGERPFECSLCKQRYSSQPNLNKHFLKMHTKKENITTDQIIDVPSNEKNEESTLNEIERRDDVSDVAKSQKLVALDTDSQVPAECRQPCSLGITDKSKEKTSEDTHFKRCTPNFSNVFTSQQDASFTKVENKGDEYFICNICNERLEGEKLLIEHLSNHTSNVSPFSCIICNRTFNRKSNLKRHMCIHTGLESFSCNICSKSFVRKSKLNKHILAHSNVYPFRCKRCKQQYRSKAYLKIHVCKGSEESSDGNITYSCQFCKEEFSEECVYKRHIRLHNIFPCHLCKKVFAIKSIWKKHLKTHSSFSYACSICRKVLDDKNTLKMHLNRHCNERSHSCHLCNKIFASSSQLNEHIRFHFSVDSFPCEVCGKTFSTRNFLYNHCISHHKIHPVNQRLLNRKSYFKNHFRSYTPYILNTDRRTYSCDVCGKSFVMKSVFLRHCNLHSKTESFSCEKCKTKFTQESELKIHLCDLPDEKYTDET